MTTGTLPFLLIAFSMGVLGSVHCIGMCGGILSILCCAVPVTASQTMRQRLSFQLCFSCGRILSYAFLGGVVGIFGLVITHSIGFSVLHSLRYVAAVYMLLLGLYVSAWWPILAHIERLGVRMWRPLSKMTRHFMPITTFYRALVLGGLWGFLPCGLVYSALFYSLSTASWQYGAVTMACFGLGTLPTLLLFGTVLQSYQALLQQRLVRAISGSILISMGIVSLILLTLHGHTADYFALCRSIAPQA